MDKLKVGKLYDVWLRGDYTVTITLTGFSDPIVSGIIVDGLEESLVKMSKSPGDKVTFAITCTAIELTAVI